MKLPETRVPDPHEAPGIRWGVLGPGGIARSFADAVAVGTASSVVAVGSRSLDRAQAFAADFDVPRAHGSYEDLLADPEVDAVYVASPHSEHRDHALLAVAAGKAVLVEKAFARNAAEAAEVFTAARAAGVLVSEAMWSRHLPQYDVVAQVVGSGLIGELVTVFADHGQPLFPDGPERLARPELAGGALLDLGVYPISFADHVMGPATEVVASGTLTDLGVDAQSNVLLRNDAGAQAVLSCTMLAATPCTAAVVGTRGRLELSGAFYGAADVRLVDGEHRVVDERAGAFPDDVRGFSYEIAEFARALTAGEPETAVMTHATTLRVMETMDEVRRRLGMTYPGE
ncbi:Gfo/Idh/MocA family protein [Terracoccus luteus]|uniref:Putative dehydrogenase n=1 Tax=Terracoccus luteus TaxID=53356 RepID=A0A839PTQ2_9MICO|nr:Gfo/Idh/MocA family oxidoreductase [Terracoccus luteus]MBB2987540.1 putative dehydrogenase [Terracoccus luteus]MCP2173191.1 putative dehydrogenase [Terracoccus luteus]